MNVAPFHERTMANTSERFLKELNARILKRGHRSALRAAELTSDQPLVVRMNLTQRSPRW